MKIKYLKYPHQLPKIHQIPDIYRSNTSSIHSRYERSAKATNLECAQQMIVHHHMQRWYQKICLFRFL